MKMMNLEYIMIVLFTFVSLRQKVHGSTIKNTTLQPGEFSYNMSNSSVGDLTYNDRLEMTNSSGFSELESIASFQMRGKVRANLIGQLLQSELSIFHLEAQQSSRVIKVIRQDTASRNIAFMATLGHNIENPSVGHIVIFDRESLDTTDSYNPNIGIYNVPVSGVYYISLTATNEPQNANYHNLHLHIKKDGTSVGYLFLDDNDKYWLRRNEVVLLHLNAGDSLYVQVDLATHPCTLVGGDFTTHFQGFLIFPD